MTTSSAGAKLEQASTASAGSSTPMWRINSKLSTMLSQGNKQILHKVITLKLLFRVTKPNPEIKGCLADKKGEVLKFDPNNEPTPQNGGNSVQLNFKSLPHHSAQIKGAKGNKPIPVRDEHELSRLYLQEFYKDEQDCAISKVDPGGILRVIKNASCFPDNVRKLAEDVREVRNKWAHAVLEQWDDAMVQDAFTKMIAMAGSIPNNALCFQKSD